MPKYAIKKPHVNAAVLPPSYSPNQPDAISVGPGHAHLPAPAAPKPVAPIPVSTPEPLSVPKQAIQPVAPTPTVQGLQSRTGAENAYTQSMTEVNRQLMQAAMRYGNAPTVQQFSSQYAAPTSIDVNNPFAGLTDQSAETAVPLAGGNDPLSAVATVGRNYDTAIKGVRDNANQANTYFSSNRLNDENTQGTSRDLQIAQAKRDYEDAVAQLLAQMTAARQNREGAFTAANSADIAAATAKAPEPVADAPAADTAPPPPSVTPPVTAPAPQGSHSVSQPVRKPSVSAPNASHSPSKKPRKAKLKS